MPIHGVERKNAGALGDPALNRDRVYRRARSLAVRTLAAVTVAFLWFAPYLCTFFEERTRCLSRWQLHDALTLLGPPILFALACVGVSELIRRLGRPLVSRLFNHLFVMALGGGLLTVVLYQVNKLGSFSINPAGTQVYTAWMLLAAVVGYSFARPDSKLVLRSCQLCQILSPMVAILVGQLLVQRTYPPRMDPLVIATPQWITGAAGSAAPRLPDPRDPARPVYLFIFDEWSYERTFQGDRPDPLLGNLSELANRSIVFTDAHSPGHKTALSLPGVLLQTDLPPVMPYPEVGFERDGRFVSSGAFDSIFSCVGDRDYHSIMLGFGFPAHLWLGDQVDHCREYRFWAEGRNALEDMAMHLMAATTQMNGPWFTAVHKTFGARVYYPYYYELHHKLERDVSQILTHWPRNTFAVMHCLLPHKPFIFREDGTPRGPDRIMYENSPENYRAHLVCLDRTIGHFIDLMKEAHTFGDALVIMTSDHSWRADPARKFDPAPAPKTRVPLFVKMPGQTRSATITDRYELSRLRPLIEFALRQEGGDLEGAKQVVEATVAKHKPRIVGRARTSRGKDAHNDSPITRRTTHHVGTHVRIH